MLTQHEPEKCDTGLCGCAGAQSASVFFSVAYPHQYECADDEQVSRWLRGVLLGPHERAHLIRSPWVPRHLEATKGSACLAQAICSQSIVDMMPRRCTGAQRIYGRSMAAPVHGTCMHTCRLMHMASQQAVCSAVFAVKSSLQCAQLQQPAKETRCVPQCAHTARRSAPSVSPACCPGERPRPTTVKSTGRCDDLVHLVRATNLVRFELAGAARQRANHEFLVIRATCMQAFLKNAVYQSDTWYRDLLHL